MTLKRQLIIEEYDNGDRKISAWVLDPQTGELKLGSTSESVCGLAMEAFIMGLKKIISQEILNMVAEQK